MIKRSIPWTSQPQDAPDIDKNNSLSGGLVFSWLAASGISPEQVRGVLPTSESGITRAPNRGGIGASVAAPGGINYALVPFIGIDKYTIAAVAAPPAAAARSHLYFSGTETGSFPQYTLAVNSSNTGANASGKFALLEYDAVWKVQAESIVGMVDGGLHTFTAVRDGTTVRLYRDGIDVTGTLGTISGTHSTTTGNVSVGGNVGMTTRGGSFPILSVQAWSRALSVQSAVSHGINPWQIFAPQQRNIYVSVAGGQVDYSLTCSAGAYTYTGQSASLSVAHSLSCAAGSYSYSGVATTLTVAHNLVCATGAYTYSGVSAALPVSRSLSCASGSYAYFGVSATLTVRHGLSCDAGSYTYAGVATTLTYIPGDGTVDYVLTCGAGAYAYTGQSVTLAVRHGLTCDAGAYSYSGVSASLQVAHGLTCDTGVYGYTGQSATLSVKRNLACATGSYDYIGNTATLDYLSGAASINYVLTCAAGAYTYAGQSATLTVVSSWPGEPFNFASPITRNFDFTSSITKTLAFDSSI